MALIKRLVKGSPLTFAEGDANLDYLYSLAVNTGSFAVNGGSSLSVQNSGSAIVHAVSVGTYSDEMTNFKYTNGSAILPKGYSCYSIVANSSFNSAVNLYLYQMTSGGNLISPVYSSPIRIINTNSAYPATIRPNAADAAAPVYLRFVTGIATTATSYNLPMGFYMDLCFEPQYSPGAVGSIAAGWRIITTGSIL